MVFLEYGAPRLVLLTITMLVFTGPTPASAQGHRERARILFREGNKLFSERRFKDALEKFQQARRLYPKSRRIDLHVAYTLMELGWFARAAENFHGFLIKEGSSESDVVKQVRARLALLRKKVGSVELVCAVRRAAVWADGQVIGRTPLPHPVYRRSGTYRLKVESTGYHPLPLSLTFSPGFHYRVEAHLVPMKQETNAAPAHRFPPASVPGYPPAPPRRPPTPLYKKWWLWTIVGAVVVGGTIAIAASQAGGGESMPAGELGGISLE